MRNMGDSDHLPGEPDGGSEGFRPKPRQVMGAIVALLLVVFIAANSKSTKVSLVFFTATLPLWVVLAVTAVVGVAVGMLLGARRTKAKIARRS